MDRLFCIVDIELTDDKEIIQFSATKLDKSFNEVSSINYYIQPKKPVSTFVTELTGISNEMLEDKKFFEEVADDLYDFIKDDILVCHGLPSDYVILKKRFHDVGILYKAKQSLDTVELARLFLPSQKSYRLSDLSNSLDLYTGERYHNAAVDVKVTVRLFIEIANKIPTISNNNYKKIENLLEKIDINMYKFARFCRKSVTNLKNKSSDLLHFEGVDFRKVAFETKPTSDKEKFILFSSIDEAEYINKFNISEFVIIKKKSAYVSLNVFSLFPKKEDPNLDKLLIKLYVWILETNTGDFSELNLLYIEKMYIDGIKKGISISSKSYYFDEKNKAAQLCKNIVTNYDSIEYLIENDTFKNHTYVFEHKKILGRELDSSNTKDYFYKNAITELNVAVSKNLKNKDIKGLRNNIDGLVKFLHEMYISESLFLYNDSLNFILQDVDAILIDMKQYKDELPVSYKFMKRLRNVLTDSKNTYKFVILEQENSLKLTVVNDKKVKSLINIIHSRKHKYLNLKSKAKYIYSNGDEELLTSKSTESILYIFESNKYKDLYFSKREKKSYIKFFNFSIKDNFSELYSEVKNNNRLACRCYATKDILEYRYFLKDIFNCIIVFRDLEH